LVVVVQIQTHRQRNKCVFLGEDVGFLSNRLKSAKSAIEAKKRRSFVCLRERKNNKKKSIALLHTIHIQRETTLRSQRIADSSNTCTLQDLFFLGNTIRLITEKRTREFVVAKEIASWRCKIPEWKKGKAVRESTERHLKKDPNLRRCL